MRIFIDESGNFSEVNQGISSPSLVGALIIPDEKFDRLTMRYAKLRANLPIDHKKEVKGKSLTESQVLAVCDLLKKANALFEVVSVDMGFESPNELRSHRQAQAESITVNLSDNHHDDLVAGAWEWRSTLESMSIPLYVQAVAMTNLVNSAINNSTMYYSQRFPRELSSFTWVVDSKGVAKYTKSEIWWSETLLPMLQAISRRKPMQQLDLGNYRYFEEHFGCEIPDDIVRKNPNTKGTNLRKMMKSLRFSSQPEPGLELVDIITNATRRALKGNLQRSGWRMLPELMVTRPGNCIHLISFKKNGSALRLPYYHIVNNDFASGKKLMFTKSMMS